MVIILAFLLISWCILYIFVFHPNGSSKNANKNSPIKRKYMTEKGGNSDEEDTTESANKNLPNHDLSNGIRQNIREPQNIQKSMMKNKRGR